MPDLTAKLDALADARDRATAIRLRWEECRDRILEPVKRELADLDAAFAPMLDAAQEAAAALEQEVRAEVLQAGATVKGARLQVVWAKGRASWDTKALDGYAAAHPEVLKFRKEGEPSVSIRNI